MNKLKWCVLLLCMQQQVQAQRTQFPDVLDIRYTVKDTGRVSGSFFSDNGAWHAYALPANNTAAGFTGPLLMDMKGEWLSGCIAQLRLYENDRELVLQQTDSAMRYYPGLIQGAWNAGPVKVNMQLLFSSNRTAILQTTIINTGGSPLQLKVQWEGKTALQRARLESGKNELRIGIAGTGHHFNIRYLTQQPWDIATTTGSYTAASNISLAAHGSWSATQAQSFYPEYKEQELPPVDFADAFRQNETRWNGYLKQLFSHMPFPASDTFRSRLAVKSMMTLLTNWRSASRHIRRDGVFPSISYQGFYGIWSWDSWKQAVGISYFDPALAQSNIQSMFDYQDAAGMVPDCIYADSTENNLRDTKPPLAAWAVWTVFGASRDTAFVSRLYPSLVRYHNWWYTARDHDHNGLCEFGSTDGTRIAAAWESGMDNAVRFDKAVMVKNGEGAWSLNQESVDLNSYLYKEKLILAQMATMLHRPQEAATWRRQAAALKKQIHAAFYDEASGYYYDRMHNGTLIRVKGPEGWIPLWTGIAPGKAAAATIKYMQDTTVFNTLVPFPVLDASEKAFDPQRGYWRGPVWIDQFYFAIAAMRQYKAGAAAAGMSAKLWNHAAGMRGNGPLHENYHPRTGKGLNASNFSWTAAHVLMLLADKQ
ncbi:MGH1-like glycoside hydrolase domain-containing protein [Chitinophaga solisilvae]|uniref:MGH1-like glycoside hydrolase domain-containing protein n=1 Tax=Chitinophaga solisilvae TaxID=1233460 RepID=UPI00136AD7CC|nr:trehalase family glycosidase [Chitinophaga solisilvae]